MTKAQEALQWVHDYGPEVCVILKKSGWENRALARLKKLSDQSIKPRSKSGRSIIKR